MLQGLNAEIRPALKKTRYYNAKQWVKKSCASEIALSYTRKRNKKRAWSVHFHSSVPRQQQSMKNKYHKVHNLLYYHVHALCCFTALSSTVVLIEYRCLPVPSVLCNSMPNVNEEIMLSDAPLNLHNCNESRVTGSQENIQNKPFFLFLCSGAGIFPINTVEAFVEKVKWKSSILHEPLPRTYQVLLCCWSFLLWVAEVGKYQNLWAFRHL